MTESPEIILVPSTESGTWSVQANTRHDINDFAHTLFNRRIQFGEMIKLENMRLIQLWPGSAYLLSTQPSLPELASGFENMITDISHGFKEINLRGASALSFLSDYCSANIQQADILKNQTLRSKFGQFSIIIWWDDCDDIHLLIDRSYAQSFNRFLQSLTDRR